MVAAELTGPAWLRSLLRRVRPWFRRDPLPCRPLVVVAVCCIAGCVAARGVGGWVGGGTSLAVPWWGGGIVGLAGWCAMANRGRRRLATASLCAAVTCAAAAWSAARFDLFRADDLAWRLGHEPTPVALRGVLVESFRRLPEPAQDPARAAAIGPSSECVVAVVAVRVGGRWTAASGRAAVVVGGPPPAVVAGTTIRALGRGLRPGPAANPGEFDFHLRARSQRTLSIVRVDSASCVRVVSPAPVWSPVAFLDRVRRAGVEALHSHLAPARAGLAAALLLGARESLPRAESDDFLVTGTIHVLSISGLHVGLLAGALFVVFRMLAVPRTAALVAVATTTAAYMVLVGAETPVVRASLLVWLTCLGAATGRRSAALNALSLAAIVVLVWRPAEVFSAGAQLSFLSTAVLVGVAAALPRQGVPADPIDRLIDRSRPPAERWMRRRAWQVWVMFVCGLAVWAATAPMVAARFHVVSPVGLVLNVAVAPLVAVAMAAGFACLLLTPVSGVLAGACGSVCDAALAVIGRIVAWGADLPGGHAWLAGPPAWWVVGWYGLMVVGLCALAPGVLNRGRTWAAIAAAWCLVGLVGSGVHRLAVGGQGGLRAVVTDVGHGCGILVRSPAGRCLLYDAGRLGAPGTARRAISSLLWSEGVSRVDVVVVSHADADHFNALPELLERFSIGMVVVPASLLRSASPAVVHLLERIEEADVPVMTAAAGDAFALDPLCRVRVLHPYRGATVVHASDNESSIVLAVEAAGRRVLLTGDLEGPALARFVRESQGHCDVLVAPHHGSRTSLPADIATATRPACVAVSGGASRSWPMVRDAYAEAAGGATVMLTGQRGAIAFDLTADAIVAARFRGGGWRTCYRQVDAGAGRVRSEPATSSASWLATYAASSSNTPDVNP